MKKNKQRTKQRKVTIHRNSKRSKRLRETQKEKNIKKISVIKERNKLIEKQEREIRKLLESRKENVV